MVSAYYAGVILIHHWTFHSKQMPQDHGGVGYSLIQSAWLQLQWHAGWVSVGIMAKGLIPILLSHVDLSLWLSKRSTFWMWHNSGLVAAINKGWSKKVTVMHILQCLWLFVSYHDIDNCSYTYSRGGQQLRRPPVKGIICHCFSLQTYVQSTSTASSSDGHFYQDMDWKPPDSRKQFRSIISTG